MSRHYHNGHHHHGHYHGGHGGGFFELLIALFMFLIIGLFQIIKACFDWGTPQSKRVGIEMIIAVVIIVGLISGGAPAELIIGVIIVCVIVFFVLILGIDSEGKTGNTSYSSTNSQSQRSEERKAMLNKYTRDNSSGDEYRQDDIHDMALYHHMMQEKADFDDQFAAMEAQVHGMESHDDSDDD